MNIRRGNWIHKPVDHPPVIKTERSGARAVGVNKSSSPITGVSGNSNSLKSVSDFRRSMMGSSTPESSASNIPIVPVVVHSASYKANKEMWKKYGDQQNNMGKTAAVAGSSFNRGATGADVTTLGPEVYSPLFQMANLQLPRDRITMNAWNRNFYDTHPLVHNCINLHATYPISKINIKCKNQKVEQFFNDMAQEMDLIGILQAIALEFWKLGEVFAYAELNEKRGIWKTISILNPDYIHVKKSPFGDYSVSMRPDAALMRLIQSSSPDDVRLVSEMDPEIAYHIRKGNNIPLDAFHVSHLSMKSSPYDIHGTSLIVSVYKDLMLYDKLRESKFAQADNLVNPITLVKVGGTAEGEYHPTSDDLENYRAIFECHDEQTEVLTDQGFKRYDEVIDFTQNGTGYAAKIKDGFRIACFNPINEHIEYHMPSKSHIYDYDGEMYHFTGKKVDVMTTPNHRMFVSRQLHQGWSDWEIKQAEELSMGTNYRFRATADWMGKEKDFVNVCGRQIKTDDYLEFLGYVISEGYVCVINDKYPNSVNLYQESETEDKVIMEKNLTKIADCFGKEVKSRTYDNSMAPLTNGAKSIMWKGILYDAGLVRHLFDEIGENGKCDSHNKRIPRWVYSLSTRQIKILLNALIRGDGSSYTNQNNTIGFKYSTISERLAKDIQELAFLAGFAPKAYPTKNGDGKEYWLVSWSEGNRGRFPAVCGNPNSRSAHITKEHYRGKVWCFTVPTGLFITKRSNLITIQGNSAAYDKDFKIITHAGVTVERVGAAGQIIDIAPDMTFILDNIMYGLMTPKSVLTQEGAAFQSASIGLEVLKQRYESFRNMMAQWLIRKIFAPISEIQEFYDYKDGEKKLIVPDIDWNQMALYDMDNYINVVKDLATSQSPNVSKATLFRSLGLSYEEEMRKIKEEAIRTAILQREIKTLQEMSLGALRSIKSDQDIIEPTSAPLPGAPGSMPEESGTLDTGGGETELGLGLPDLSMPEPTTPPPATTTTPTAPKT